MRVEHRLSKLEQEIVPTHPSRVCVVFGDADADTVVAQFRTANDWPDDPAHPVQVMRVLWGAASSDVYKSI
jgi:hypothetical protein